MKTLTALLIALLLVPLLSVAPADAAEPASETCIETRSWHWYILARDLGLDPSPGLTAHVRSNNDRDLFNHNYKPKRYRTLCLDAEWLAVARDERPLCRMTERYHFYRLANQFGVRNTSLFRSIVGETPQLGKVYCITSTQSKVLSNLTSPAPGVHKSHNAGVHIAFVALDLWKPRVSSGFGHPTVHAASPISVNGDYYSGSTLLGINIDQGVANRSSPEFSAASGINFFGEQNEQFGWGFVNSSAVPETAEALIAQGVETRLGGSPSLIINDGAGGFMKEPFLALTNSPPLLTRQPRTATGLMDDGNTLIIVVVDGRQPGLPGITADELADYLLDVGAERAILHDGGGSSAMASYGVTISQPSEYRSVANRLYLEAR